MHKQAGLDEEGATALVELTEDEIAFLGAIVLERARMLCDERHGMAFLQSNPLAPLPVAEVKTFKRLNFQIRKCQELFQKLMGEELPEEG